MYNLHAFGQMIADSTRMAAYSAALRRCVQPGSVVVDIGTGTGIFALIACRLGARKVYAIEPNDWILVGSHLSQQNGCQERIAFLNQLSTRVQLPEKADVIISDLRGVLPFHPQNIPSILDARQRFLKPGGILIPQKDRLFVSLVRAPKVYQDIVSPWRTRRYGVNLKPALPKAVNNLRSVRLRPSQVIGEPQPWAEIDYQRVTSPHAQGNVVFEITQAHAAHGLGLWFETSLLAGIGYATSPFGPKTVYAQMFFPLERPLALSPGDQVSLALSAILVGEEYIWRWRTRHLRGAPGGAEAACFDQSTFLGAPLNPEKMRRQSDHWVPTLNLEGRIDRAILAQMDQQHDLAAIAQAIQQAFPERFASQAQALERVKRLSEKYSQ